MTINTILIIAIILLLIVSAIWYLKHTDMTIVHEEFDNFLTVPSLSRMCRETFSTTMRRSVNEMNLTQEEYNRVSAGKEELKTAVRTAPYCDTQAKQFVLSFMKDVIQNQKMGKVGAHNINQIILFDEPAAMKPRDRFEILAFLWLKEGAKGFSQNFVKYGLDRPKKTPYGNSYEVTVEDIERVYEDYIAQRGGISYPERIDFLNQRVYEDTYGMGAVDLLLETDIDEIQGGTSGIPAGSYEVSLGESDEVYYSFESVWIVFHGLNIHLKCTTFGTQAELERVCRNIYRYNAPTILTKKDAGIIGSMKNGSRVTVCCPPFSDSYAFLVRKFDSTPSLAPEKLL